jgi:L-histidine Nalpha-methyltransferase
MANAAMSLGDDSRRLLMLDEVRAGLHRSPRELPSKYFYDERGSRLFEEITRLPEYYLTRAEREILIARGVEIAAATGARSLVELGAGSASKTRILLAALREQAPKVTYVPLDVSEDFLHETGAALQQEFPSLVVEPVVADIGVALDLPRTLDRPILFAFLGSTIGNFESKDAVLLLERVRDVMRPDDHFLLGVDLRKDPAVIHAAYNDAAGVTAEFNRNILRVMNAELDADFVPECFAHRAFYDEGEHRIEMRLDSVRDQVVHIPGIEPIVFARGESIRTELSHKYDRAAVEQLCAAAGLVVTHWFTDSRGQFALSLLALRDAR